MGDKHFVNFSVVGELIKRNGYNAVLENYAIDGFLIESLPYKKALRMWRVLCAHFTNLKLYVYSKNKENYVILDKLPPSPEEYKLLCYFLKGWYESRYEANKND